MKILGISLLRLGDLILQRPLLEGLRKRHPQSEIHLLINKQFAQGEFLFAGIVDRFIYFDRESLQRSGGEKEYNIFWGFYQLQKLVQELNEAHYDRVYNLTHNRLSAHLMGLLPRPERIGIFSQQGRFSGLETPWIRFFNNYFGRPEATGFHYTELLARAMDIPLVPGPIRWRRPSGKRGIVIQPLTSDAKKNWGLPRFQSLVSELQKESGFDIKVIGAPFEESVLRPYFAPEHLLICSLEEAATLLQNAALLITGDTSVKHLAALHDVPILELALGSSQPLQVGAYSNNSVILQPRLACVPCVHSEKCPQVSHLCGEKLGLAPVLQAARSLLNLERPDWDLMAQRHPELQVLKTEIRDILGWTVQCLSVAQKDQFEQILQKKTVIVEELNRHHQSLKGASGEQRTRKLPEPGADAS